MTDEKDPPPEGPVQRYRFRVKTSDGRELVSHIASVRLPPRPAPAQVPAQEAVLGPAPLEMQSSHPPAAPAKSYVPTRILVSVQSTKQGPFTADKGGALDGHHFMAIELDFALAIPRDAATGQASGKRLHRPVVLTKELGPSTPQFRNALATNETLTSVAFSCYGVEQHGGPAEVEFFTMKLTNAGLAAAELVMPNSRHPDLTKIPTYERLSFTYQSIEWTWKDGGITAQDTWAQSR